MKKGGTEYLVSIHEYKVEVMPLLQYQLNKDACLLIAASLQLIALY
jgi:hypothetical protein